MFTTEIVLKNVSGAHAFVHLCDQVDCLVELEQGPFLMDGRSIIAILSLDLMRPIRVKAHCRNVEQTAFFAAQIAPFEVPQK